MEALFILLIIGLGILALWLKVWCKKQRDEMFTRLIDEAKSNEEIATLRQMWGKRR